MTVQGIEAQGIFMEKVPNTFLRGTPFSLVCLASNSFPKKLRAAMPIVLCLCIGLRIPQNWDAFFAPCPLQGKNDVQQETQETEMRKITLNGDWKNLRQLSKSIVKQTFSLQYLNL